MKIALVLLVGAFFANAQEPVQPMGSWRSGLSSLPPKPPAGTTAQDVTQFEKDMRMAAIYLGNTSPNANTAQWEANRDLVRRMSTYLYGLQALSDPRIRGAVTHAQHSFDSLGLAQYLAYAMTAGAPYPDVNHTPAPTRNESRQTLPPFALNAPELNGFSDSDKDIAAELRNRYETDAATSAAVWGNAEVLRENLELRGMGLNLETATSMVRLPQQFRSAATALRNGDWEAVRTHLDQAEVITEKIARTVGR